MGFARNESASLIGHLHMDRLSWLDESYKDRVLLSLILANALESQSARLSTQSKPATYHQIHGFSAIEDQ
jgi:hypothetical protein